jgi:type IV fimbrial biogenesis protein FimT
MARQARGFTLLELIVTVLVAAIVLTVGLPSMAKSVAKSRQSAEINALFHAFHLARKESIRRRGLVSICPSRDAGRCTPGVDWSSGWLVFANLDRDEPPERDTGEPLILAHEAGDNLRITANRRGFTSRGIRRRATNGTIVICDAAGRIPGKALVVSYTGRPRVAGRRRNGDAYTCTDR